MESCGKKRSRKSCGKKRSKKSCGQKSGTSIKAKKISYYMIKNRAGRNPFFHYLAYFRKCNKKKLSHLPACKVNSLAGRQWTCMSAEEREPFIFAASSSGYTYQSRSKKVNWVLGNLQEYVAGGECQELALWNLMSGTKSWQRHSLLNDQINK